MRPYPGGAFVCLHNLEFNTQKNTEWIQRLKRIQSFLLRSTKKLYKKGMEKAIAIINPIATGPLSSSIILSSESCEHGLVIATNPSCKINGCYA
jgi:hypothetical protein